MPPARTKSKHDPSEASRRSGSGLWRAGELWYGDDREYDNTDRGKRKLDVAWVAEPEPSRSHDPDQQRCCSSVNDG